MKKLFRRNQVVLTVLAVLVAVAGYITLTDNDPTANANLAQNETTLDAADVNEQDVLDENKALEQAMNGSGTGSDTAKQDEAEEDASKQASGNPGEAVLTSGVTVADFMAGEKLSREQVRAANKETLLEIINSEVLGADQKQAAIDSMLQLTQIAEKESATETLLHAKGFEDALVSILDGQVNVVICANSISDVERAQIEDIVKQKTEMRVDQIVITLMELQEMQK